MKILYLGSDLIFDCVPREYPKNTDSLLVVLTSDLSNTVITPGISFIVAEKLSIKLISETEQLKSFQKFDIDIQNNGLTIYKGKLMILEQSTNPQNFGNDSNSSSRFKFKD